MSPSQSESSTPTYSSSDASEPYTSSDSSSGVSDELGPEDFGIFPQCSDYRPPEAMKRWYAYQRGRDARKKARRAARQQAAVTNNTHEHKMIDNMFKNVEPGFINTGYSAEEAANEEPEVCEVGSLLWRSREESRQRALNARMADAYESWISYTHLGKRKALNVLPPKGETDAGRVAHIIRGLIIARDPKAETGVINIRANWSKDPTEEDYNEAKFVSLDCLDEHIEKCVDAEKDYSPYLFTIWF